MDIKVRGEWGKQGVGRMFSGDAYVSAEFRAASLISCGCNVSGEHAEPAAGGRVPETAAGQPDQSPEQAEPRPSALSVPADKAGGTAEPGAGCSGGDADGVAGQRGGAGHRLSPAREPQLCRLPHHLPGLCPQRPFLCHGQHPCHVPCALMFVFQMRVNGVQFPTFGYQLDVATGQGVQVLFCLYALMQRIEC